MLPIRKPGVACVYSPSTQKVEAGGLSSRSSLATLQIWGQLGLYEPLSERKRRRQGRERGRKGGKGKKEECSRNFQKIEKIHRADKSEWRKVFLWWRKRPLAFYRMNQDEPGADGWIGQEGWAGWQGVGCLRVVVICARKSGRSNCAWTWGWKGKQGSVLRNLKTMLRFPDSWTEE